MRLTFAEKADHIISMGLTKDVWFVIDVNNDRGYEWEIAEAPRASFINWMAKSKSPAIIEKRTYSVSIKIKKETKYIIFGDRLNLFDKKITPYKLLKSLRLFARYIRFLPAPLPGSPGGSSANWSAIPGEIAGNVGEFLWNRQLGRPKDVLNFALVCKRFADGVSRILREIADAWLGALDPFMEKYGFVAFDILSDIKNRNFADIQALELKNVLPLIGDYVLHFIKTEKNVHVRVINGIDFIHLDGNSRGIYIRLGDEFASQHIEYKAEYTTRILKKYEDSPHSLDIFVLVIMHTFFEVLHIDG